MATVSASKYGWVSATSELGWMTARDATTGNSTQNQSTSTNTESVRVNYVSGGKGSEWLVKRQFLAFNVTAYQTGYTITDLKLYYKPTTSTTGSGGAGLKVALVKSTAQGNANADLTTSDINNFDDTVDYADNDGLVVWRDLSTLQYWDLNSTAISAITSTGYLKICVMQYLNDYPDTAPTTNPTNLNGYSNYSTIPYLSFTATATGYGNDVIGVGHTNINKIITVSSADISEVIGA